MTMEYLYFSRGKRRRLPRIFIFLFFFVATTAYSKTPEISSTALKLHKRYTLQPPHDMSLYHILQVSPNATAAQITQSYRHLARKYHPDKTTRTASNSNSNSISNTDQKLQEVQKAYEILKDDATRLPYHKHGLTDPTLAVILLLGPHHQSHNARLDRVHRELLELMGYTTDQGSIVMEQQQTNNGEDHHHQRQKKQQRRIRTIAARLVEQLRPIVEGTVDLSVVAHMVADDCDRWKGLPLGAQIVRCVGRAYRHAGRDYLQKHHQQQHVNVAMRQQWRRAKDFWTAIFVAGRASVTEQVWTQQEKRRRRKRQKQQKKEENNTLSIESHSQLGSIDFLEQYDDDDNIFSDNDDDDNLPLSDEEAMKQAERLKAQQTLLQSLQVEALWKITKIDLDKTIRKACNLILQGEYFFFPAHQSLHPDEWDRGGHGWVASSGKVINAEQARLETAHAMVMIGDIMVQRSKEGTSWKD